MDTDPRGLSLLGSAPYGGQHAASILGGAPRRSMDELIYAQGSSSAGYGVGLPPGRDYVAGKGLRGPSLESDYQGSILSRAHPSLGVSMLDERKDDRNAYHREIEIREEERHRELMREREKREREERVRERDRERERDRLRERRDKERERDRKHLPRRERTPPRATRDRRGSSTLRDEKRLRRVSPHRVSPRREALHRWTFMFSLYRAIAIIGCCFICGAAILTNCLLCYPEGIVHLLKKKRENISAR